MCVYACVGVRVYVCTSGLHKCEPLHMWVECEDIYVHEHVWIARVCVWAFLHLADQVSMLPSTPAFFRNKPGFPLK